MKSMSVAQAQVLLGLSHVVQRIDAEAQIRYLTNVDLCELSTTDAHQYRRRVEIPQTMGREWNFFEPRITMM